MYQELLIDMFDAAPEVWYTLAALIVLLILCLIYASIAYLKLRQKNYFLNRDRERYAETLYASKDGYFAFIHPDRKVNDPRREIYERCSRRLAVILSLENGTKANFDDVLKSFYKDDAKKIQKYAEFLREEGVSFEDDFLLKTNNRRIRLSGSRINGIDGNIYCDMIWFRDISFEASTIAGLMNEKYNLSRRILQLEDFIDNISYPVWMRDENANLVMANRKYAEFMGFNNKEEVVARKLEIIGANGESVSSNLAVVAISTNKPKSHKAVINKNGERLVFNVSEAPFYAESTLDKICTVGAMTDITELDNLKRNLQVHQSTHLDILGSLGTAFALFDQDFKLAFYNKAFARLWKLEDVWMESLPTYSAFLDTLRFNRMLPEVPDFILYKSDEQKDFSRIIEAKEDLLHLPNSTTIRRVRAPHPAGGLFFAFEDVSDKLATKRAYNSLLMVRKEILNNLSDAVLIFASDGKLKFYNKAYVKLWKSSDEFLQKEPSLIDLIESQSVFFGNVENWQSLKQDILNYMTNMVAKAFNLNREDGVSVQVSSDMLSDGSVMVTYKKMF